MGETVKENTFVLPDKTIVVKYIKRKKGMASNVEDDHVISGGMLAGACKRFQVPLLRNGSLMNILTSEEKEFLEKETGLNLSIYGEFWHTYFVSLYKDDNRFDLNNPMDYIAYKTMLALKDDVATCWEDRNKKLTYQFVISSDEEELNEKKSGFDSKKDAFKLYGKIEEDREKLIGVLKLLTNKPISKETSLKWIQTQVEEVIDAKPESFVALMKDINLDVKLLIHEAHEAGIIVKSGSKYKTEDGLSLCETGQTASFENAVKYLENLKHQDVRNLIEAKLNSIKK